MTLNPVTHSLTAHVHRQGNPLESTGRVKFHSDFHEEQVAGHTDRSDFFISWSDYSDSQIIYPLPGHKNHETSGARTTATKSVVIRRQVEKRELA